MGALDSALDMLEGQSPRQQAITDPGPQLGGNSAPVSPAPDAAQMPAGAAAPPSPAQPAPQAQQAAPDPAAPEQPQSALDASLGMIPPGSPGGADDAATPQHTGTIQDPVNISPVSIGDRAKLSLGNARGQMKYLRGKFEDVTQTADGLLVKKGGKWHQVDPGGLTGGGGSFSDRVYEFAKDIADLPDVVLSGIGMGVGEAVGAGVGGKIGAVGGAIAGGGPENLPAMMGGEMAGKLGGAVAGAAAGNVLAGRIRSSLGRVVGTYEPPSPQEELKDSALDALYAIGGQAVAVGTKPTLSALASSAKWVGGKAPRAVQDMFAMVLGKTTGAGTEAMQQLFEAPGKIVAGINKYLGDAGGNSKHAVQTATFDAVSKMKSFLTEATQALPQKWAEGVRGIVEKAGAKGAKLEANMGDVFQGTSSTLEEMGFGRIAEKEGKFAFIPFEGDEIAANAKAGLPVQMLDKETVTEVNKMVSQLGALANSVGTVKGKEAAHVLVAYNKLLNQLQRRALDKGNSDYQAVVNKIAGGFRKQVGQQFEKAELSEEYTALSQIYNTWEDQVGEAHRLLNLPAGNGPELALNRIAGEAHTNSRTKTVMQGVQNRQPGLTDLVPDGASKLQDIAHLDATRKFIPALTPVWGVSSIASGAAVKTLGVPLAASHPYIAGAAFGAGFSPRLVAKTANFAAGSAELASKALPVVRMGTDFLKRMTPAEMKAFMTNDKAVQQFLMPIVTNTGREEQMTKDLLQQSGAIPDGQQ